MKKLIALILTLVLMTLCMTVPVGAVPVPVDVYSQQIAFYDSLGYQNPVICYQPAAADDTDEWQTEEMRYSWMSGANGEKIYYFNFPSADNYVFYITDGARRTSNAAYKKQNLLVRCYNGYTDIHGYDQIECSVLATTVPEENAVFFNNDIGFIDPVIYYRSSGTTDIPSAWKSAPMVFNGYVEYGEYGCEQYRFDFPREVFCFYITDGTRRTEDIWFAGSITVQIEDHNEQRDRYEVHCDARFITTDPWFLTQRFGHGLYYNRLEEYLSTIPGHSGSINAYDEVIHKDADGNRDWVLIYAKCGEPEWSVSYGTVGNRVFFMGPLSPFRFGLGLYDVKEDTFYDLSVMKDYERYDGLLQAIDDFGIGKLIGDLDRDNQLTIIDVTFMQRCLAKTMDYPADDIAVMYGFSPYYYKETYQDDYYEVYELIAYYSDFNRDGERNIIDATCIQRYLAGMKYPIG